MKMHLRLWAALFLCLCALLLCGMALADMYSVTVANYAEVRSYCQEIGLFIHHP